MSDETPSDRHKENGDDDDRLDIRLPGGGLNADGPNVRRLFDGLYFLFIIIAVGIAVALIINAIRGSIE